jgi:hypothetical protein
MAERATPKMPKSPPELVARFEAVLAGFPDAARKPMFGYPAAFVGGNLATSLFHDRWIVRLAPSELPDAIDRGATPFEPMPGRPMKGFVAVPKADVDDDTAIRAWVERGLATARSLPAKT